MKYYEKAKLSQIIMDLIYLYWEMRKDGHIDNISLKAIQTCIDQLKYHLQFLK